MAGWWVKSLQCRSRAFDDVFSPSPKTLIPSSSCRNTAQNIKDVVETAAAVANKRSKPSKPTDRRRSRHHQEKPKPTSDIPKPTKSRPIHDLISAPVQRPRLSTRNSDPVFPALTELSQGHPSRNVVEIIFHTSWGDKPFAGRVEMIFKVQNGSRTVNRFEEYREAVKSRAGIAAACGGTHWEENGRCVADGNEMMRFYCLGPAGASGIHGGGTWEFPGGKGSAVCTFSGSGMAHESAGCGGRGRRAMLVCRVISGRVSKQTEYGNRVGFDSVSGESGELLVFDPRAVLPCFLIIYKL